MSAACESCVQLRAERDWLNEELDDMRSDREDESNSSDVLLARAERAEEALKFYADGENYRWSEGPEVKRGVIQAEDKGARARQVLEELR